MQTLAPKRIPRYLGIRIIAIVLDFKHGEPGQGWRVVGRAAGEGCFMVAGA